MEARTRSIGVYGPIGEDTFHRCVAGVLRYCDQSGGLMLRDFQSADMDNDYTRPPPWTGRVDGMVISMGKDGPIGPMVDWVLSTGVPTVSVAADWFEPRVPACVVDSVGMAASAAKHLLDCQCKSFLFVGFAESTGSATRARGLRDALARHGQKLTEYQSPVRVSSSVTKHVSDFADAELIKHLHTLRKPIGVWALNDNYASAVCLVCEEQGLAVPEMVKVLGVGDLRVARLCHPSISTIRTPSDEIGFQAARTLHAMIEQKPGIRKLTQVRATELLTRESTVASPQQAADLDEVMDYINRHACDGVSIDQLADIVGMSRRSFEEWFRKKVGQSPGREVQRVRIERAKHLVGTTELSMSQIAGMIGYEETAAFSKFFRNETGMSPREFRQRTLPSHTDS